MGWDGQENVASLDTDSFLGVQPCLRNGDLLVGQEEEEAFTEPAYLPSWEPSLPPLPHSCLSCWEQVPVLQGAQPASMPRVCPHPPQLPLEMVTSPRMPGVEGLK
jgi:hypothetical protein